MKERGALIWGKADFPTLQRCCIQPPTFQIGARFGGAEGTAGPLVRDICIRNGLMVRGIRDSIVMCPPLIITPSQIDDLIGIIRTSLDEAEPKLRAIG